MKSHILTNNSDLSNTQWNVVIVESFNAWKDDKLSVNWEWISSWYDSKNRILHLDWFFQLKIRDFQTTSEFLVEHIKIRANEIFPWPDEDFLIISNSIDTIDVRKIEGMVHMYYVKILTWFSEDEEAFLRKLRYKSVPSTTDKGRIVELNAKKEEYKRRKKEEFSIKFNSHKWVSWEIDLF